MVYTQVFVWCTTYFTTPHLNETVYSLLFILFSTFFFCKAKEPTHFIQNACNFRMRGIITHRQHKEPLNHYKENDTKISLTTKSKK